jgi:hypothetical protein
MEPEEDVHYLVGFLEVPIAFIDFLLSLLIMRVSWLRSLLECPPQLVTLFGGVVVILMPWTLLFEEVLEAARGLLGAVLRRALYSCDSVV